MISQIKKNCHVERSLLTNSSSHMTGCYQFFWSGIYTDSRCALLYNNNNNNNNSFYLPREHHQITVLPGAPDRSNWNLGVLVFVEGRKPENPEKNPRSKARTNNKLNRHETASTGIELGSQRWEASAYPLRHPCAIRL